MTDGQAPRNSPLPSPRTPHSSWLSIIPKLILLVLVVGIALSGWLTNYYRSPGPLTQDATVMIERGMGGKHIARKLAEHQVIEHPVLFKYVSRIAAYDKPLQAGEYAFTPGVTPEEVLKKLKTGDTVVHRVTVPEGFSVAQIRVIMAAAEDLTGDMPDTIPEGSLMPDTYHFHAGDSREALVQRMQKAMQEFVQKAWQERAEGLPLKSSHEAVTLASIVEKETGIADERGRVAAVFINRLRMPMRLQSDPTIIYGITGGMPLDRPIYTKDLKKKTPYNTYVIDRLPPGPIANPSRASITAVLNPPDTDELYFVADGKGGHVFAKTLKQHNRNVAAFRKWQKQQ